MAKSARPRSSRCFSGEDVNPAPVVANTCYSYVDDRQVGHVTSVHAYDRAQKTMLVVPGSGGLVARGQ